MRATKKRGESTKRLRFALQRNLSAERRAALAAADEVTFLKMEAIGENGTLDTSNTKPKSEVETGYSQFFDGDVLVAKITPCFENGKGALARGLLGSVGYGTTELHVLTPLDSTDGEFLYWITVGPDFRKQGEGQMTGAAGQKRVSDEFVRNFRAWIPPLNTQRAIAAYLDRETTWLDELVRAKEHLLQLVGEKRRALTTRAVTRGLQPKVRLRDSGIHWLGPIPEHWEIERSKWLFTERDERSATGEEEMLTVSHLTGVTPRSEKDVNMFEAETTEGYKLCQPGDLVINTLWAWMGAMGIARDHGMVSPAYNVYTPNVRLFPDYVDALVRIPTFAQEAIRFSKGVWSSRLRLYPEGLYEIWFPVPPLEEQRAIVTHIGAEMEKLNALQASAERTIRLLKERRSALISAAVTGRIPAP